MNVRIKYCTAEGCVKRELDEIHARHMIEEVLGYPFLTFRALYINILNFQKIQRLISPAERIYGFGSRLSAV